MNDYTADLAVLRTPLLPFDDVERWRGDRETLRAIVARPEIREALFVATPALVESLAYWERDPSGRKGQRAERGLVRYFLRMATRPTPFGLFSGCTVGGIGERTRLALAERSAYRRHSRLDMDYLFALCEHLGRDRALRMELTYRPNASLYEAAGRLRYAEARLAGRRRTYHLVAVDAFDALRVVLERAGGGATLRELAATLVDDEITIEDAEEFVHDLVDNQLLVADLAPPVTGDDSLTRQLARLGGAAAASADVLHRADSALAALDERGLGSSDDAYCALARELEPLGVPVELSRLVQIDLLKPAAEVVVGRNVVDEILRGVELLHRTMSRSRTQTVLDEFRAAFRERYGEAREVPLLEVLDEESGIGFERAAAAGAEASPLLAGLPFVVRGQSPGLAWNHGDAALIRLLTIALAEGRMEIELSDADVKALENPERPPLPDAFHAVAMIAAPSAEAVDRGEFRVFLHNATGPSGARMLGRFSHADPRLRAGVEEHLRTEEMHAPDALFAEIVHLPAGRVGNVLARPVLRGWEIPFLGRSGAPRERQIAVDDLVVTVAGDRIQLRSRSLGREVVPRLTTAHNTTGESLGVYRFLAALQQAVGMEWTWGPLEAAPFLPRVVSGRLVLSRARWRLRPAELAKQSADEWRRKHRMPRYVALVENDHELLVDFENPLGLEAAMDLFRKRDEILLTEVFPSPDELCAAGPEGRFTHELIIPFTRKTLSAVRAAARPAPTPSHIRRTFPPGAEWLYVKLYTGTGTADRILRDELAPLAHEPWFFIRYGDPSWHLRVRFRGEAGLLLPQLRPLFQRLLDSGTVWKVQLDTYEREVERYGGDAGMELSEQLFVHDTRAVLAMLESFASDAGADLRWRMALVGMDRLLDDFGYDLPTRLALAERARDGFAQRYRYDALRSPLADRFRNERSILRRLLLEPDSAPDDLQPAFAALRARSHALRPVIAELRARLHDRLHAIVPSYVHMFVNRLARSAGPEHELVLYDYLVQLYRSQLARAPRPGKARRARRRIDASF